MNNTTKKPVRNQVGLRIGEMLPGSTDNGEPGVPVGGKPEQNQSTPRWVLCELCHGVAHDPDPEGWGEPCDNCAGHGGRWVNENGEAVSND